MRLVRHDAFLLPQIRQLGAGVLRRHLRIGVEVHNLVTDHNNIFVHSAL